MRNLIRKWLQVERYTKEFNQAELRREIGKAVEAALQGTTDNTYLEYYGNRGGLNNILTRSLEKASVGTATHIAKEEINNKINSEKFIDEIVERIKRKQLV